MRTLPLLFVLVLVFPVLAGCLTEDQGPFTVVEVDARIEGEGPREVPAACSVVPPSAAVDRQNRTIEVAGPALEGTEPFELLLLDDRFVDDPADEGQACPPRLRLRPSSANATWSLRMRGYEHKLSIQADDRAVVVNGTRLEANESLATNVSFTWTNPRNDARYNYTGTIRVEAHDRWPASALETVEPYDYFDEAWRGGFDAARWQTS